MKKISELASQIPQFGSQKEAEQYCANLLKALVIVDAEVKELKRQLALKSKAKAPTMKMSITPEEAIIEQQVEALLMESQIRALSTDEVKRLESLMRSRTLIQGKPGKGKLLNAEFNTITDAQLLEQSDKDK